MTIPINENLNLQCYRRRIQEIQSLYLEEIQFQMVDTAILNNIDRMVFGYNTHLFSNGKEVENKEIEDLENNYCEEIHSSGFQGIWTKEKGWIK